MRARKALGLALPAFLLVVALLARPAVGGGAADDADASAGCGPSQLAQAGRDDAFTAEQKKAIEMIIKDYLLANPDVLLDAQQALDARMEKVQAERARAALKENAGQLFRSASTPVVGNSDGDVTIVEFFDYNCPYCKRAMSELTKLIQKDSKLRVVMKEFPILNKGSEEAARLALAARNQGKYWELHRALLEAPGQANEASALRLAEKLGLDMARLKKDSASAEVRTEIEEARALAEKMGIRGTPYFLVGDRAVPGAPENLLELLTGHVQELRTSGCPVC
jgi:protein-disulfide isomerase